MNGILNLSSLGLRVHRAHLCLFVGLQRHKVLRAPHKAGLRAGQRHSGRGQQRQLCSGRRLQRQRCDRPLYCRAYCDEEKQKVRNLNRQPLVA